MEKKNRNLWFILGGITIGILIGFGFFYYFFAPKNTFLNDGKIDLSNILQSTDLNEKDKQAFDTIKDLSELSNGINAGNDKYDLQLPEKREKKELQYGKISVTALLSPLEGYEDIFRENITITTEYYKGSEEEYQKASLKLIQSTFSGAIVSKTGTITINNKELNQIFINYSFQSFDTEICQTVFQKDHIFYILGYTYKKGEFEKFKKEYEFVLNTFKIK